MLRRRLARLLPLGALLAAGCGGASAPASRDVLLVTIDTLRHDYVSAYEGALTETPVLAALAAEGVVFERHYTTVSQTAPAHVSLLSGQPARAHGLRHNGQTLDGAVPWLPEAFQRAGYRTAAVVGASVLDSKFGLDRGFDVYDDDMSASAGHELAAARHQRVAADVTDRALALLAEDDDRPLFLWVHYFDPHEPYLRPLDEWADRGTLEAELGDLVRESVVYDRADVVEMHAGYAAEVRHVDGELGRLLAGWDAREQASVVAVTSDHGEGLGEHGYQGHALYVYEEQVRVPMLLRLPGGSRAGERVERPSSATGVAGALRELAGVAGGDDRGLLRWLDGDAPDLVFAERAHTSKWRRSVDPSRPTERLLDSLDGRAGGGRGDLVTVIDGDAKLIWAEDVPDELFALAEDPHERDDLAPRSPDEAARLRDLVEAWKRAVDRAGEDFAEGELDEETQRMLDDLGY